MARARKLARIAMTDQKLANSIKNQLLLPIKKNRLLPSGEKVKAFKTKWAKRRRRLATVNSTSKFFGNFISNLTFTGKFLSSFKAEINKGKLISYEIGPTGDHKGYKLIKGGRGKSVPNEKIGEGQIAQRRDYTVVSNETKKAITKKIIGRIRREFKLKLNI